MMASDLQPGDMAPDITLAMPDGGSLSLAQLRGRPLVLYFYPKDDTPGCTTEAKDFSARKAAFDMVGVDIIGVSKNSAAQHGKFATKHDLTISLATDIDDSVCAAFGTWVEKSLYGRKYMGIDRATFLIDAEGRIVRIWRKVKVPGHAQQVLEAAEALARQ
jgi:peroxiredoxin Q/BCP